MAPAVPSGQPKWAALLQTGGQSTPEADLAPAPSPQAFPGLGKTQAGNILASLASQPTAVKQPAAAPPGSSPTTPLGAGTAAPVLKPRQAPSQLPGTNPGATSPGTPSLGVAPAGAVATSSPREGDGVSSRPTPNASANGRAADGRAADGRAADGRAADGGPAEPDQGSDDILPSKPRSSLRLRLNFRLPRLKRPTFRLR